MKTSPGAVERVREKLKMRMADFMNGKTHQAFSRTHLHALKDHLRQALKTLSPEEYRALCILRVGEEDRFLDDLVNETLGLGPLDPLLKDPSVSEIMVNGPHDIFVEREGRLERVDIRFHD
ncbi:MAG: CpaF family protein, partial [Candidatus Omnitrophica bacterium]|nr:CpaF family protein [Candidatus Omnitrophota bacterium]